MLWASLHDKESIICILFTYIRMTHYKSFSAILLTCKVFISSTNCQMTHHPQLSNYHYIMPYNLTWYIFFKMINLTHMISIFNSVFTVVFYMTRWTKLDTTCICFEEFINQHNLLYICICLYLQWDTSYETHKLGRWSIFLLNWV
jgi:hypothetical protein